MVLIWMSTWWIFLSPKRQSNRRMRMMEGRKVLVLVGSFLARELVFVRSYLKLHGSGQVTATLQRGAIAQQQDQDYAL